MVEISLNTISLTGRETKDSENISHIRMLKHRFTKYLLLFRIHDYVSDLAHKLGDTK